MMIWKMERKAAAVKGFNVKDMVIVKHVWSITERIKDMNPIANEKDAGRRSLQRKM